MSINELGGSPKESLNENSGSSAERRFLVPFNQRITFAESLVGTAYPNFPQSRIVAIDIQPWKEDLAVTKGTIVNAEDDTAGYGSQPALVVAKYGPDFTKKTWSMTKPSFRAGTELRYQIRGSAKFLTVPASGLKWEDDGDIPVPEDVNSVILIPMKSIRLQWDFVDSVPFGTLDGLLGKVNQDSFLDSEAETLLFEDYDVSETFRASATNPHTNRVTVQMTQRRVVSSGGVVGWNHDYRESPAGWAKMLLSDGNPRYKLATFGGMFA